jgi:O-antigen/teichoic acid export membrane protein
VAHRSRILNPAGKARWRAGSGSLNAQLGASFLTSLVIQGLNVITGVVLARALGPHGRGELAAVLLWPSILAAVGTLGVTEATTYHAARASWPLGRLVGTTFVIGLLQSVPLVGLGAAILPFVLFRYDAEAVLLAYLYLLCIPIFLFDVYAMTLLQGLHRFASFNVLRFLVIGVTAVGLVSLDLVHGLGVGRAVYVYLGSYAVTGLVAASLLFGRESMRLSCDRRVMRELLGFGIRSHLGNVSNLLNERLDQLIISIFLAPAKLGLYVVAVSLTSLTTLPGASISLVALPSVARSAQDDERTRKVQRLLQIALITSLSVTIPMLLLTGPIISLFFGSAFRPVTNVARVLLIASVILGMNRVLSAVARGIGRPLDAGVAEGLALVVTVLALAILLPVYGLMGAAVASVLAYLVSTGWMLRKARRALGVSMRSLILPWQSGSPYSPGRGT